MPLLSVVIPVFNEQDTILDVGRAVFGLPVDMEVVVVDDCSTDGTATALQELQRIFPSLRVFRHEKNGGKTEAVKTGIAHTAGEIVIVQDADLEQNPMEIPRIIEPIVTGKADAAFGSRFLKTQSAGMTLRQTIGNRLVTWWFNLLSGKELSDVETGYKAIRGPIFRAMVLTSKGFGMEIEIPAKLAKLGITLSEVPISYQPRNYDNGKKIRLQDGFAALWYIVKYNWFCSSKRSFRPLAAMPAEAVSPKKASA